MIICKDLVKIYWDPITDVKVSALRGLDLFIKEGDVASIIGPSGAGKTTLVKILSGLEKPSGGSIFIDEINIAELSQKQMKQFRFEKMGIVSQFVHQNLLSNMTLEKNILFPMKMRFVHRERALKETDELIKMLNLNKIRTNPVTKVSGGEAVRTSIGVALAKHPRILLADEPTGMLDTTNTNDIIETFRDLNQDLGTTILVVTHDLRFRNAFQNSFIIRDGRLVGVNLDQDRGELEFILRPQESVLQSVIDSSQFIRIPDELFSVHDFKHIVEFDIHPSKRFSAFFNPDEISRDEVIDLMKRTDEYATEEEEKDEDSKKKVSFSEIRPILEQEFPYPEDGNEIIKVKNLFKSYPAGRIVNEVLKDLSFTVNEGDFVVISGKSGAGKTTLMNTLGGIETPDSGDINIKDFDMINESGKKISFFRFHEVAMISQMNNLFDQYTIRENMIIPRLFRRERIFKRRRDDIPRIVQDVEIDHKIKSYAAELSAGERQRAALAVALARRAPIILADEPTANLDSRLARNIVTLLMETAQRYKTTIIMSTHDLSLVRPGFRLIKLQDGRKIDDFRITKDSLKGIIEDYLGIEIADN
ncbi:MAG: ATP-binding cassette domain-containing protein [Asgard group archaeon]|nr:ATP-binding cassette domain-containing protein [Asgard group archaeon]